MSVRGPSCLRGTGPGGEPPAVASVRRQVVVGIERTRPPKFSRFPKLACIMPSLRWSRGSWGSVGRRASVPEHSLSARYTDHLPWASQSSGRIDAETGVERYNWSRSLAGEPQRPVALPAVCRTRLACVRTRPECSGPHRWDHQKHSVSCRYNCKSSSGRAKKVKGKG